MELLERNQLIASSLFPYTQEKLKDTELFQDDQYRKILNKY